MSHIGVRVTGRELSTIAKLSVRIIDKLTGEQLESRVQVLSSGGRFVHPEDALLKVGPGLPFFYSDGAFELDVPRGATHIRVERGTEYTPVAKDLDLAPGGVTDVEIGLERWNSLAARGWHPGNTHIHYDENEQRPDARLRLDPRVEDLRVTAVSVLTRRDLPYATNKYPIGMLTDFSTAHHYVEVGEENRHNIAPFEVGYGHVMLLRLRDVVEPISRGILVDDINPDYPPLCYACDEAHRQGGLVIWCHNGLGMEAPVATALGKLDALNLFDPCWMEPEYDLWYALLNCGFRLPASTGSDWFISSANRVYAYTGRGFDYSEWFEALRGGRSFITNGASLFLRVDDHGPGATVVAAPSQVLVVTANWESHYSVERVEIIWNGQMIAGKALGASHAKSGELTIDFRVPSDGWLAGRLASHVRDSYFQPIFAHTSPVYVTTGLVSPQMSIAAKYFSNALDSSLAWVNEKGKFLYRSQHAEVVALFKQAQAVYDKLIG